jgi:hypothetical protein
MSEIEEARGGKAYKNSKEKDVTFRSEDRGVMLSDSELQILKTCINTKLLEWLQAGLSYSMEIQ